MDLIQLSQECSNVKIIRKVPGNFIFRKKLIIVNFSRKPCTLVLVHYQWRVTQIGSRRLTTEFHWKATL